MDRGLLSPDEYGELMHFLDTNDRVGVVKVIRDRENVGSLPVPLPSGLYSALKMIQPEPGNIGYFIQLVSYAVMMLCDVDIIRLLLRGSGIQPGAHIDIYRRCLLHYLSCCQLDNNPSAKRRMIDIYNYIRPTCTTWNLFDAGGTTPFSIACFNYNIDMMTLMAHESSETHRKVDLLATIAPFSSTPISSVIEAFVQRKGKDETKAHEVVSTIIELAKTVPGPARGSNEYSDIVIHLLSPFAVDSNIILFAAQNQMVKIVHLLLDTIQRCRIIKLDEFISPVLDTPLVDALRKKNFPLFCVLRRKAHCSPAYCTNQGRFVDLFEQFAGRWTPEERTLFFEQIELGPDCQWPQKQGTLNPREGAVTLGADDTKACFKMMQENNQKGAHERLFAFIQSLCVKNNNCHPIKLVTRAPVSFRQRMLLPAEKAAMPLTSLMNIAIMYGCNIDTIRMLFGEGWRSREEQMLIPPVGELRDKSGRIPMHYLAVFDCKDEQEKKVKVEDTFNFLMGTDLRYIDDIRARTNASDYWNMTPFLLAMYNGQADLVARLLQEDVDPDTRRFDGMNPLLGGATGLLDGVYKDEDILIANINVISATMVVRKLHDRHSHLFLGELLSPLAFMAKNGQIRSLQASMRFFPDIGNTKLFDSFRSESLLLPCVRSLDSEMYDFLARHCGVSPHYLTPNNGTVQRQVDTILKDMKKNNKNPLIAKKIKAFELVVQKVYKDTLAGPRPTKTQPLKEQQKKTEPLKEQQKKTEQFEEEEDEEDMKQYRIDTAEFAKRTMANNELYIQSMNEARKESTRLRMENEAQIQAVRRGQEMDTPQEKRAEARQVIDFFEGLINAGKQDEAREMMREHEIPISLLMDELRAQHLDVQNEFNKAQHEYEVSMNQLEAAIEKVEGLKHRLKDGGSRHKGSGPDRAKDELARQLEEASREMMEADGRCTYANSKYGTIRARLEQKAEQIQRWEQFIT